MTTKSDRVVAIVNEVHLALGRVLQPAVETNSAVVTQALKTLAALVQITPYARLDSEWLLGPLLPSLHRLLTSPEQSVAVNAAVAMGTVLSCSGVPVVGRYLASAPAPSSSAGKGSTEAGEGGALLPLLLNLATQVVLLPVRLEALHVLVKAVKNHGLLLRCGWTHSCHRWWLVCTGLLAHSFTHSLSGRTGTSYHRSL